MIKENLVSRNKEPKANTQEAYYVYLACCANGTFYVGYTKNVHKRIAAHNAGRGGRYTRINRPVTLVASWAFNSRAEAIRTERSIKRLPPAKKLTLAQSVNLL